MTTPRLHLLPLGRKEERILVDQLRAGSGQAFEMLYHRYAGRVIGLARQLLRDRAAAEDATQETFIRVYRSIHRFRGDSSLARWIHRIATNVCLTEIGKRKRTADAARERREEAAEEPRTGGGRELALSLSEMLRKLEPRKQVTFYLCHVEGMSAAEIAAVLEESRAAVLKRLQRTRQELLDMWCESQGGSSDSGRHAARGRR